MATKDWCSLSHILMILCQKKSGLRNKWIKESTVGLSIVNILVFCQISVRFIIFLPCSCINVMQFLVIISLLLHSEV